MSRFNRLYSVSISEYCKCEGERWIVDGIPYVRSRKFYHRSLYILHAALTQAKNLKLWCILVSFLLLCYIKYQTSALVLIIDVTLTSICNMYTISTPPPPNPPWYTIVIGVCSGQQYSADFQTFADLWTSVSIWFILLTFYYINVSKFA